MVINKFILLLLNPESVVAAFDVVPLEVRHETLVLESKESVHRPYLLDSELVSQEEKWFPDPGRFRLRWWHFLSCLAINQQLTTLLRHVFCDTHVNNCNVFFGLEDLKRML